MQALLLALFFRLAGGEAKSGKGFAEVIQARALPSSAQPLPRPLSFLSALWSHLPGVPGEGQVPRLAIPQLRMLPLRPLLRDLGREAGGLASSASWTPKGLLTSYRCLSSLHFSFFTGKLALTVSAHAPHHPGPALSTC